MPLSNTINDTGSLLPVSLIMVSSITYLLLVLMPSVLTLFAIQRLTLKQLFSKQLFVKQHQSRLNLCVASGNTSSRLLTTRVS